MADVELAHDHAHDELDQELRVMDHDHALAGGLELFFIIYFHNYREKPQKLTQNYAKRFRVF